MTIEQSDIYKANYRSSKIKSCLLDYDDLIQLFADLEEKVNEAVELEVKNLRQTTTLSHEDFEKDVEKLKTHFKLEVQIIGEPGEQIVWRSKSAFEKEKFPNDIKWITYENHGSLKSNLNYVPRNTFDIRFDFTRAEILDFSDPLTETPNASNYVIYGSSDSWVTGVEQKVLEFIKARKKNRNLLHTKFIYTLALLVIILPATFWLIFRLDKYIKLFSAKIPTVLSIGIYVYIFFLILFFFRMMFNYLRWIFPLLEFQWKNKSKMMRHRIFFSTIFLGLIIDFIRFIFH